MQIVGCSEFIGSKRKSYGAPYLRIQAHKVCVLLLNSPLLVRLPMRVRVFILSHLVPNRDQEGQDFLALVVGADVASDNKNRHQLEVVAKYAQALLV